MNLIPAVGATADALTANKLQLEVISQNIANANTTRSIDGGPYQRQQVLFESYMKAGSSKMGGVQFQSVRVSDIVPDQTKGQTAFMPHHPHADANGMVTMPNVKISMEMVDLISATRSYEANLSVIKTSREMATQALQIGR